MNQKIEERTVRLQTINSELVSRGLKPLRKLGLSSEGEIEIVRIVEIYDHSRRFFTDVKLAVVFPGGAAGEFTVRFNANGGVSDGAVIVVLVNGKFAFVKQWRLPLCHWTYEVSRGFGEKLDQAQIQGQLGTLKIGDLPLGTVARELGEEVLDGALVTSITHLGNIAENSGTSAVVPGYFLVQLQVDRARLTARLSGSEDNLKVCLWSREEAVAQIGSKIADNHSIVALSLALRYIDSLPRL